VADRRSYGQFCGFAAALDVLGDRWTLLIVRELVIAPRRFNELAENLPGIGPNLLSERLRSLTDCGVIERATVDGDARGRVYALGEAGRALREPVLQLARWGMQFMTPELAGGETRAEWCFLAIGSMIDQSGIPDRNECYEFHVDDEVFTISVSDGAVTTSHGANDESALQVFTDARTFIEIGAGLTTPFEAAVSGRLIMTGDLAAVNRCNALLGLAQHSVPSRKQRSNAATEHSAAAKRGRSARVRPASR
jgi:DNA-binding HxlR family transcriptional regulator